MIEVIVWEPRVILLNKHVDANHLHVNPMFIDMLVHLVNTEPLWAYLAFSTIYAEIFLLARGFREMCINGHSMAVKENTIFSSKQSELEIFVFSWFSHQIIMTP